MRLRDVVRPAHYVVHFCLTNGGLWIFAILTKDAEGRRAYYLSRTLRLERGDIQE